MHLHGTCRPALGSKRSRLALHFPDFAEIARQAFLHKFQGILSIDRRHIHFLQTSINPEHPRLIELDNDIARAILHGKQQEFIEYLYLYGLDFTEF